MKNSAERIWQRRSVVGKARGAVATEGDNGKALNAASHAPPPQRLQMEFFDRLLKGQAILSFHTIRSTAPDMVTTNSRFVGVRAIVFAFVGMLAACANFDAAQIKLQEAYPLDAMHRLVGWRKTDFNRQSPRQCVTFLIQKTDGRRFFKTILPGQTLYGSLYLGTGTVHYRPMLEVHTVNVGMNVLIFKLPDGEEKKLLVLNDGDVAYWRKSDTWPDELRVQVGLSSKSYPPARVFSHLLMDTQ